MGRGFTGGYFCYFGVNFHQILGKGVNAIVACIGYKNSKSIEMELLCFCFAQYLHNFFTLNNELMTVSALALYDKTKCI